MEQITKGKMQYIDGKMTYVEGGKLATIDKPKHAPADLRLKPKAYQ